MRYLIDTNVVLRRADADSIDNAACADAVVTLLEADHDLCVCAQILIEFWAVSTRPKDVNGLGMTSAVVSQLTTDLRKTFTCLPEPPDMADRWQAVADKHSVAGKQAHDARIVAIMNAHGISRILTLNTSDFARYDGIMPITPQEIVHPSG